MKNQVCKSVTLTYRAVAGDRSVMRQETLKNILSNYWVSNENHILIENWTHRKEEFLICKSLDF